VSSYVLSGTGTQALSAGVTALHVSITTLPAGTGAGSANPTNYFHVAALRFGDGTGYWTPFFVEGGPQWFGVPAGTTQLGYSVFGAGVITVTEVIGGTSPFVGPTPSLEQLADVSVSSVADGQVLEWIASASNWQNRTPAAGGPPTGTVSLGADAASITLPGSGSFAGTGHALRIRADIRGATALSNVALQLRVNGDSANHYAWLWGRHESGNVTNASDSGALVSLCQLGYVPAASGRASASGPVEIEIPAYAGTTFYKNLLARCAFMVNDDGSGNNWQEYLAVGRWNSTAAITSVTLSLATGNILAGSSATYWED
jgi:hypothetical protein